MNATCWASVPCVLQRQHKSGFVADRAKAFRKMRSPRLPRLNPDSAGVEPGYFNGCKTKHVIIVSGGGGRKAEEQNPHVHHLPARKSAHVLTDNSFFKNAAHAHALILL